MPFRRSWRFLGISVALQTVALAQTPAQPGTPLPPPRVMLANLPQPPVPNDPLELAAGNAQPVQDANQRMTAINLLSNARASSNVRGYPYDLKTTFMALGSSSSDGSWQLEDTSPGRAVYRWTAQGPSYSAVNLFTNRMLYGNQSSVSVPLRLAQVRSAIFFEYPVTGPRASLRIGTGALNGAEVTCVLVAHMTPAKSVTGGRHWDESESCVDSKSGLLMTYSPVPGLYVLYDYSNALHFHDKIIPGKFTITQAGQTIIEAHTVSVTDPANLDHSLFDPSGLTALGVGPLMSPAWTVRTMDGFNASGANSALGIVILHGMVSPDGHLIDTEVLASSNSSLNQQALDRAAKWQNWRAGNEDQPGATPQSHEVFFTVQFVVPAT